MRANRPVTVSQAAGFPFDTWEGVHHRVAEADLRYFADATHNTTDGEPLVLVQCKAPCKAVAGVGQVRSYAFWIKPAYYITTAGDFLTVYNYQGGAVPDVKVLEVKRPELRQRFDQIYAVLNPRAARQTRIDKIARLNASTSGS